MPYEKSFPNLTKCSKSYAIFRTCILTSKKKCGEGPCSPLVSTYLHQWSLQKDTSLTQFLKYNFRTNAQITKKALPSKILSLEFIFYYNSSPIINQAQSLKSENVCIYQYEYSKSMQTNVSNRKYHNLIHYEELQQKQYRQELQLVIMHAYVLIMHTCNILTTSKFLNVQNEPTFHILQMQVYILITTQLLRLNKMYNYYYNNK
eukprot:TRINITY_DN21914_c0_g1_i1.p1 TRINITY_DN21914_c0_g1~~TRINITY_DN21914_c0_g1_i1.p1  ORF type:complete len:204 (+),score=-15.65 TRINITY_DN21914_c0_g1_i1:273-884(+)